MPMMEEPMLMPKIPASIMSALAMPVVPTVAPPKETEGGQGGNDVESEAYNPSKLHTVEIVWQCTEGDEPETVSSSPVALNPPPQSNPNKLHTVEIVLQCSEGDDPEKVSPPPVDLIPPMCLECTPCGLDSTPCGHEATTVDLNPPPADINPPL
jgi:hypothetical protein